MLVTFSVLSVAFAVFGLIVAPDADSMGGTRWIDRVDTAFIVAWQACYGAVLATLARLLGGAGDRVTAKLLWVAAGGMFTAAVAGGIEDGFRVAVMFAPYVIAVLVAWVCQVIAGVRCLRQSLMLGCCLAVPPVAAFLFDYIGWITTALVAAPLIWLWERGLPRERESSAQ